MKGIKFKIPNNYGMYLFDILKSLDIDKFIWDIYYNEVLNNFEELENILPEDEISGEKFYEIISKSNYYIINFRAIGYKKGSIVTQYPQNIDEFEKSNCDILVDIYDSSYASFFCRDEEILEMMYKLLKYQNMSPEVLVGERLKYVLDDVLKN